MRVLVTGSHGYVGSVVGPALVAHGHDVMGLDTLLYAGCDFGPDPAAIETLKLDVRDVTADALDGFDAVVHLAALSNDPLGDLNDEWTYDVNLRGTVSLARAAKEAGVTRFVFASSCSMYGRSSAFARVSEDAPLVPLTPYAASKVRSEDALAGLADDCFSPVFLRYATAYGVSSRLRLDVVLNNLVAWAHTTGRIRILSDGTPWRPLVHVADMAQAILAVLDAPRETIHTEAFNVGRDIENYQVKDLAEIVAATIPGCEVEYGPESAPDPRSYRVDFTKFARAFPECRLTWTARSGARELVEAYRERGLRKEEFEGEKYTRVRHLRKLIESGSLDQDLRWNGDGRSK